MSTDATTGDIRIGRLARDMAGAEVRIVRGEGAATLSFSASSETPVERFFGTEVLSHEPSAVRMDRLAAGAAPLLFNHDWNDPIGMIDGASVQGGRLMVDAHLFDTQRAKEVGAMVAGGLRNVSIGYEILQMTEDTKRGVYTATEWMPLEVSVVTVPADISVGMGRSGDDQAKPVPVLRAAAANPVSTPAAAAAPLKESTMDQTTTAAATNPADTTNPAATQTRAATVPAQPHGTTGNAAVELEAQRRRGIDNLCRANNIDDNIRQHWVGSGLGLDQISEDLLQILEARGKSNPKSDAQLGLSTGETRRYSLMNAVRACADKNWSQAGFELECSREIAKKLGVVVDPNKFYVPFEVQGRGVQAKRDLTAGTANAGGYLVATENQSFIEMLRNRSVAYRMGARSLSGLQGSVTIPRQTAAATAYWLSTESTSITESQQTFGQLALTPKSVGAYTEISRQLMLQSSPDAEAIVTADLAKVAALAVDVGVIRGSGSSGEPTGIVNTAGIGSVTGTSLAYAGVLEFQTDIAAANVMPARGGYVTTPAVAALLMARQRFSSTDTPLWTGNLWDGQMVGFPAMSSAQMSSATMLFGDWDSVVVGEWGVLQVEVNPYANFVAGIIGVRAMVSMDVGLRYAPAFSYASSIT